MFKLDKKQLKRSKFSHYNLNSNSWSQHTILSENQSRSLWKSEVYNDKIYFATASGILICNYLIADDKFKLYFDEKIFERNEIYDIDINHDIIYFSSEKGLLSKGAILTSLFSSHEPDINNIEIDRLFEGEI